jgi:hypothetical protein
MIPYVLTLVLLLSPSQDPDKMSTVRAYVFTDTSASGESSPEERGRLDAVRDMREALAKKKGITIVDDRADATLFVEVVDREQGEEPTGPFGGKSITKMGDTIIRLHIRSAKDEADIKGLGQGSWGRAAKDAAERILKWIARREPKRGG